MKADFSAALFVIIYAILAGKPFLLSEVVVDFFTGTAAANQRYLL